MSSRPHPQSVSGVPVLFESPDTPHQWDCEQGADDNADQHGRGDRHEDAHQAPIVTAWSSHMPSPIAYDPSSGPVDHQVEPECAA